jgi:hypothetical protein
MLLAKHEKVMFAHGAQTIKSGTSVKSALIGSHILSRHVLCVIPCDMQQPLTSGSLGMTAMLFPPFTISFFRVNARFRELGKLEPNSFSAVTKTAYIVNGCKLFMVVVFISAGTVTLMVVAVLLAKKSSSNDCKMVTLIL